MRLVSHAMEVSDPVSLSASMCVSLLEQLQTGHRDVLQHLDVSNSLVVGVRPGCIEAVWKYMRDMSSGIAQTELLYVVLTSHPSKHIYDLLVTDADVQLLEACIGGMTATTEYWPLLNLFDGLRSNGIERPSPKLAEQLKTLAFGGKQAHTVACQAKQLVGDWLTQEQQW